MLSTIERLTFTSMSRDVSNDVTVSSRAGYDWSRATTTTTVDDTSLTVTQATKHDSGEFTCTTSNGLGDVVTQTAVLIVKCERICCIMFLLLLLRLFLF